MKKMLKLIRMMKNRPLIDVWYYLQGSYRYKFYYGNNLSRRSAFVSWLRKKMIRVHIKEQIAYRIEWMDKECYNNGECKLCGCQTTALQMSDKPCDKPCYPPMMIKEDWSRWWSQRAYIDKQHNIVWHRDEKGKPYIYFKP